MPPAEVDGLVGTAERAAAALKALVRERCVYSMQSLLDAMVHVLTLGLCTAYAISRHVSGLLLRTVLAPRGEEPDTQQGLSAAAACASAADDVKAGGDGARAALDGGGGERAAKRARG